MVQSKSLLQEFLYQGQLPRSPSQDTFSWSPFFLVTGPVLHTRRKLFEKWLAGIYIMTKWPGSTHLQKKDGDSQPHLWMNTEVSGPSADTCPGKHLPRWCVRISKSLLIWSWSDYVARYRFNTSCWSHPTCSLTVIAGGSPWCSYWLYLDLGPLAFICMLLDWVWKRKLNRCSSWVPDCFLILWKGSPGATRLYLAPGSILQPQLGWFTAPAPQSLSGQKRWLICEPCVTKSSPSLGLRWYSLWASLPRYFRLGVTCTLTPPPSGH